MADSRKDLSCPFCGQNFFRYYNFNRHVQNKVCLKKVGGATSYLCNFCSSSFAREDIRARHERTQHGKTAQVAFPCGACEYAFDTREELDDHRKLIHLSKLTKFREYVSVHKKTCLKKRMMFPPQIKSVDEALYFASSSACVELEKLMSGESHFKVGFSLLVEMYKLNEKNEMFENILVPFRSPDARVFSSSQPSEILLDAFFHIRSTVDEFLHRGSGWIVNDVIFIDMEVSKCIKLTGGCDKHKLKMIRGQGYAVQSDGIKPEGEEPRNCFYLAVAEHFCSGKDEKYLAKWAEENLIQNVATPVEITEIKKFEKANSHLDLAINVVWQKGPGSFEPLIPSDNITAKNVIALVFLKVKDVGKQDNYFGHYVYCHSINKLLSSRKRNNRGNICQTRSKWVCFNCFMYMRTEEAYVNHCRWCHKMGSQIINYPRKGDTMHYKWNFHKENLIPYTFFFDFEAMNITPEKACSCPEDVMKNTREYEEEVKAWNLLSQEEQLDIVMEEEVEFGLSRRVRRKPRPKICTHKTKTIVEQHAFAYSLILVDRKGKVVESENYYGEDCGEAFLRKIIFLGRKYRKLIQEKKEKMVLTAKDKKEIRDATRCHICRKELDEDGVRDHDHLTGDFIGMAHNFCNLKRQECLKFPAFAHNFSGYDSHIIVKSLPKVLSPEEMIGINAIPLNTQKFKVLEIGNLIFMDSAAFMGAPLAKLVETLCESKHPFPLLDQMGLCQDEEDKSLLVRKGVYPYSFATSIERLCEEKQLPPASAFTNDIGGEKISQEDYAHAKHVWKIFRCRNMLDYTTLYCTTDVFLLAEVITDFRNKIYSEFRLDLCQYWSLPMMAKDIMLKYTGAKIELMNDPHMIQFVQENIRGGLSYINTRYAEAVSGKGENDVSILYADANNLYGHAMSFPLPQKNFAWMSEEELQSFDPQSMVTDKAGPGYILEVTLDYPSELHFEHNSFPLAPEQIELDESQLSPYSLDCLVELTKKKKHKAKKLSATFNRRERYVLHGLNLKLYLKHGLKLIKIHRGIKFYQAPFIKPYIDFCTKMRAASTTKSMKDLFKLLCNSIYGKMIESILNRMECKFDRDAHSAAMHATSPLYKGFLAVQENMSVAFLKKKEVNMNQSWAVGFAILELSKYAMQKLFYEEVRPALNNDVSVLMSDTDSWILAARKSTPDEIALALAHVMDFSNYDPKNALFDDSRRNAVGFLKNEVPKAEIVKYVGLRAKAYAFQTDGEEEVKKCKGVSKIYTKKIAFQDYARCLQKLHTHQVSQISIRSKDHINSLVQSKRVAFSSFDDKRYLLCPIHSVPYGSSLIKKSEEMKKCYFCHYKNVLV